MRSILMDPINEHRMINRDILEESEEENGFNKQSKSKFSSSYKICLKTILTYLWIEQNAVHKGVLGQCQQYRVDSLAIIQNQ